VQSLGLSVTEKASFTKIVIPPVAGVKIGGGKLPSTSATRGGAGHASARAVDLYASSASDKETIPPKPHRKHSRSSHPLKAILKPSDTPVVEGTTI
jgi:hypothetical protein